MNKERVEHLCDLLLVRKFERTIIRDPTVCLSIAFSTFQSGQVVETYQTPFRCMGPILTTCRTFSLFRIPSRRPLVMPATFSNLVPLIMWLSAHRLCQFHLADICWDKRANLLVERHRCREPRPGSISYLRPPKVWQSREASFQQVRPAPSCRNHHKSVGPRPERYLQEGEEHWPEGPSDLRLGGLLEVRSNHWRSHSHCRAAGDRTEMVQDATTAVAAGDSGSLHQRSQSVVYAVEGPTCADNTCLADLGSWRRML